MPESPEQRFSQWLPGYDVKKARRTKKGNPYWLEYQDFEPGTYGQAAADKPLIRLSKNAKPWELPHEEEHIDQLYGPGYEALNAGYDPEAEARKYLTFGLSPEEAQGLAYGLQPIEIAARQAAGDPGQAFQELLQRVEALKSKRLQGAQKKAAPKGAPTTGIAGARYK